jgi:Protein of unknown function (DUF4058)
MPIHDWTRVHAGTWHDFHLAWIAELRKALNKRLPPDYYAQAEQKTGPYEPDLLTLHADDSDDSSDVEDVSTSGGTALLEVKPKTRYAYAEDEDLYDDNQREIAIRHVSKDRLVAVIELISPGNKSSTWKHQQMIEKAREYLAQGVHLLIVDLFPPTLRSPEGLHRQIWENSRPTYLSTEEEPLLLMAYVSGVPREAYVEPTAVGRELIDMPLFLSPSRYINVPLEQTYLSAYEDMPPKWKKVLEA